MNTGFPDFDIPASPAPASCGTDRMAVAAEHLRDRLRARASTAVTYTRGAESIGLCATLGRTKLLLSDDVGVTRIEWTDRDFIVSAEDLVLGGDTVRPSVGDRIAVASGPEADVFEVLPYGDEPCWKWADPFKKQIRIHAKRISTGPA